MNEKKGLKILLLGPVSSLTKRGESVEVEVCKVYKKVLLFQCGKTTIANYLSDATENTTGEYRPTKGVRILEFVVDGVRAKGVYQNSVDVELWDCSGDNRYQSCWPAIQHKADGIMFLYTEASNQQKTDLDMLHGFFIGESNFPESCCLILKNEFGSENRGKTSGENPLPSLSHVSVNLEERGVEFKKNFNSFLSSIMKANYSD